MPGRAKSETKKAQLAREERDSLMAQAVQIYLSELQKPEKDRKGARTICEEVSSEHERQTGRLISLHYSTLLRHVAGGKSLSKFNEEKGWLLPEEVEKVIKLTEELSERNIPLNHKTIQEAAEHILRVRLGDTSPGVGKNWVDRFIEKHSDRIKTFLSSPIDSNRAQAVNPITHEAWFKLLGQVLTETNVEPDCIFAADETGFIPGMQKRGRCIGKVGKKSQKQTQSGRKNIITVLPVICADGSSLPPSVIFQGHAFNISWKQDNPLNASIGYSQKGYTDGEIGYDWIKNFHELTKHKAHGRPRVLIVDGHSSRLTLAFLLFCREKNIHVLCYPSHTTHVYQGLDVVIFGILKTTFSEEMLKFESETGQAVCKANFLQIYAPAHVQVFTSENIVKAFEATGVWPLNPDVISPKHFKPSIESSCTGSGLPLPQPSPVKAVAKLITQAQNFPKYEKGKERVNDGRSSEDIPIDPILLTESEKTVKGLSQTSAAFLVSQSPIKSSSKPPLYLPSPDSLLKIPADLLSSIPSTELEEKLQDKLEEYIKREAALQGKVIDLQASLVLQNIYCEKVRRQLHAKEQKKKLPKGTGRLLGDGLPRLLTGDSFTQKAQEHEEYQLAVEAKKERRREARKEYTEQMKEWKRLCAERKERNDKIISDWQAKVVEWEQERDAARREKRKIRWNKPKRGPLEPTIPKPKLTKGIEDELEFIDTENVEGEDSGSSDHE